MGEVHDFQTAFLDNYLYYSIYYFQLLNINRIFLANW